jgi:Flp pilus assembly protein TadG
VTVSRVVSCRPRARSWQRLVREDDGNAVVEFCVLGVLMLIPIVYLVISLGRIEAGSLAVQRAARESGRVYVTAASDVEGRRRAQLAAELALADQGFSAAAADGHAGLVVDCDAPDCLAPDARVTTRATLAVVLPGVPGVLDRLIPLRVEVTATQVTPVDRFRPPTTSAVSRVRP